MLFEGMHMPKMLKPSGPKFSVKTVRSGNYMNVYVSPYGFDKKIRLDKWGIFSTRSPRERITAAIEKAEHIAEELNHKEDIMAHEAQVSIRI